MTIELIACPFVCVDVYPSEDAESQTYLALTMHMLLAACSR